MKTLLSEDSLVFNPPQLSCVLFLSGLPGSGNKIYDRSPYGNIGTITGATWVRLPNGLWCLSFDGTDDKVNCGSGASLDDLTTFTWKFWYYHTANVNNARLMDKDKKYFYTISTTGRLSVLIDAATTNGDAASGAGDALATGAWYYLVVTYDDNGDRKPYIYKNAVDVSGTQTAAVGALTTEASADFILGNWAAAGERPLSGNIALFRVHKRVLSILEIQNDFNREKHLFGVW